MSNRRGASRVQVAILLGAALIVFAGLVEGIASWLSAVSAPVIEGDMKAVNTDPLLTWENMPKISETKARQIAMQEVKHREGWVGTISKSERGELGWDIEIGHEGGVAHDYRFVAVDSTTGAVVSYQTLTVTPKKP
ncbi:MAG TPA: PepSY domain-containing protein [Planctomycetaceae bacterium]|jgi:hypothetical protein|nr:PepSY domain-containing protein [Planctomycetaceae bacterium]